MKSFLLLTVLLITATAAFAQLTEKEPGNWQLIGKLKFGGITKSSLEFKNIGTDTSYLLFIKDQREGIKGPQDAAHNYFAINFKNTGGTYTKLYTILKSFFLDEHKKDKAYSRTFELGNTSVNVSHKRLITSRGIMFYTKDGYTTWSENDIDKLFGFQ
jgi:hypothetical protein